MVFDYRKSLELIADIPGRLGFVLDACLSSHKDKDIQTLLPIKVKLEFLLIADPTMRKIKSQKEGVIVFK